MDKEQIKKEIIELIHKCNTINKLLEQIENITPGISQMLEELIKIIYNVATELRDFAQQNQLQPEIKNQIQQTAIEIYYESQAIKNVLNHRYMPNEGWMFGNFDASLVATNCYHIINRLKEIMAKI